MRLAICLCVAACGTTRPPPVESHVLLTSFERTDYGVSVYRDGRVEYHGENGDVVGRLSREQVDALEAAFAQANFFELDSEYVENGFAHKPYAVTAYVRDGRGKRVWHYVGAAHVPRELDTLEGEIDRIVGSARYRR